MARVSGNEDFFDSILMADNRFHVEGYQEGFDEGKRQGMLEGHRHGASHGAKVSNEVSFYSGFAITWIHLLQSNTNTKSRKRTKALENLVALIQKFPHDDPLYENLLEDIENIRAKFRQVCSLLRVPTDFCDNVKGSSGMTF